MVYRVRHLRPTVIKAFESFRNKRNRRYIGGMPLTLALELEDEINSNKFELFALLADPGLQLIVKLP
jgi:hypothetical protein